MGRSKHPGLEDTKNTIKMKLAVLVVSMLALCWSTASAASERVKRWIPRYFPRYYYWRNLETGADQAAGAPRAFAPPFYQPPPPQFYYPPPPSHNPNIRATTET